MKIHICNCRQCRAAKSKRHKAGKKIKRMVSKKRRNMLPGQVYNFYYA